MEAVKVILYVVDHDKLGAEEIATTLMHARYPNDCISPMVISTETADIGEWTDSHPLNHSDLAHKAFELIFPC